MKLSSSHHETTVPLQVERLALASLQQETKDGGKTQNPVEGASETSSGPSTGDDNPPIGDPDDQTDAEPSEPESTGLPLDQVFEILKNSRRRQALHYLKEHGGTASLSDLAEHIAALENDTTVEAISSSQRKRVYVGLYQCHLPKMDDMDIVDFDQNRGTIELAANASQLDPYLEDTETTAWYRLYSTVTVVGLGLFAVSTLGSAPLGLTPATVLAALLAVMALCSLSQVYVEGRRGSESSSRL